MHDAQHELARHIAPGGWLRGVVGVAVGAALGALVLRLLPADPPRGGTR